MSIDWFIVLVNFIYALGGSTLAIFFMVISYIILDRLIPYNAGEQLNNNNIAIGIVIAGMYVGIGLVIGNVIAKALN